MSKGIIVVDVPERCNQCKFWFGKATVPVEYRCMGMRREIAEQNLTEKKPDWCPIHPIPEKMEVCGRYPQPDGITASYKIGWNACIDELMKEA